MSLGRKKKDRTDDPRTQSSSSGDEDFYGFLSGKNHSGSHMAKSRPNPNNNCTDEQVLELRCIECKKIFNTADLMMDKTTYDILTSMEHWGSRWHCLQCLSETNPLKLDNHQENKTLDKTTKNEIDKIQIRINELQTTMDAKLNTLIEKLNTSTTTKPSEVNSKSWAEIVCGDKITDSGAIVQNFAKQVANTQKQIATDREERENNVIIFNVPEEGTDTKENDALFFTSLCKENLKLAEVKDVKITRLGIRRETNTRPLKVSFDQNWDKRKFLSSLFRLKNIENFSNLRVSHDMSESDRTENKRLLKEAHRMNDEEKPEGFKYKVRGPPWAMKIVKVRQAKN